LVSVLFFFFDGFLSNVKTLPTIAISIVVAISRSERRAITIWEAIQKRGQKPIYKTYPKIEAKRLRATTFAIAKLEER